MRIGIVPLFVGLMLEMLASNRKLDNNWKLSKIYHLRRRKINKRIIRKKVYTSGVMRLVPDCGRGEEPH